MDDGKKKRAGWIKVYQETKDASLTYLKYGISQPSLRK